MSEQTSGDVADAAKSSQVSGLLPTGYLDKDGNLHKEVVVREMTGHEEDMLAGKSFDTNDKMLEVIRRCTLKIGSYDQNHPEWSEISKNIVTADSAYLTLKIREATLGTTYSYSVKCPNENCGVKNNFVFDLNLVKFTEMKDPKKRSYEGKTPTGIPFTMRVRLESQKLNFKQNRDNILSYLLYSRLVSLDGKAPTIDKIASLSMRDRKYLRAQIKENEATFDSTSEMVCSACDHEWEEEISIVSPDFFFPTDDL